MSQAHGNLRARINYLRANQGPVFYRKVVSYVRGVHFSERLARHTSTEFSHHRGGAGKCCRKITPPTGQSHPLNRNIPHPPTNRNPSLGIFGRAATTSDTESTASLGVGGWRCCVAFNRPGSRQSYTCVTLNNS
eukprot:3433565-Pyramimonas_sp.AAC.2